MYFVDESSSLVVHKHLALRAGETQRVDLVVHASGACQMALTRDSDISITLDPATATNVPLDVHSKITVPVPGPARSCNLLIARRPILPT